MAQSIDSNETGESNISSTARESPSCGRRNKCRHYALKGRLASHGGEDCRDPTHPHHRRTHISHFVTKSETKYKQKPRRVKNTRFKANRTVSQDGSKYFFDLEEADSNSIRSGTLEIIVYSAAHSSQCPHQLPFITKTTQQFKMTATNPQITIMYCENITLRIIHGQISTIAVCATAIKETLLSIKETFVGYMQSYLPMRKYIWLVNIKWDYCHSNILLHYVKIQLTK